jgi:hypothetical protein
MFPQRLDSSPAFDVAQAISVGRHAVFPETFSPFLLGIRL